ncbi:type 1 fimbriae anchoring protein FimD [Klebsiella pneumoniae]|uniref:Type 1 fimbriae anchoring protein FimD n=1 Tax=Klebsiella pneumoniae TaxID=573 RepID=A0A377W417_KLEPN|nr:type 1 fimbriae anchoring protein FimD [Klebsiella pneumoniae]STW69639.1 type 1 fimbriae anchoring protein FimD [Klebsiella pneumoniae]
MRHGPAHTVTVVSLSILLGGQSALLHAQATFNMDLLEKTTICRQWICNASISRRASRQATIR